jgi:hypothetical protein
MATQDDSLNVLEEISDSVTAAPKTGTKGNSVNRLKVLAVRLDRLHHKPNLRRPSRRKVPITLATHA